MVVGNFKIRMILWYIYLMVLWFIAPWDMMVNKRRMHSCLGKSLKSLFVLCLRSVYYSLAVSFSVFRFKNFINHLRHVFTGDLTFEFYNPINIHSISFQEWISGFILFTLSPAQPGIILRFFKDVAAVFVVFKVALALLPAFDAL